ncbi:MULTISPECIES: histidine phosphatase family protein [unclassified Paenibacillus]|uniref:histidine phosphatase family protein n=1 Tax=unclassified Paenibacillus TaxID=185978 RepID=UPI002406955A|nr:MULTISPECIES: histidine phosphatase family protein [unclassified Paenibacillus]MDF9845098.1 broad specificity phosphatase PhoE [Paenibacillus sp. PastF-2]MDF9851671.1 broad specificity phosphatase PhoE [Paenibacillus sp. PastM-2]MDF9858255.1 broad specificity phosphatase PhoE [Paenibacillus sp. PastF-1]MDH6483519.1 broad specificity phosphatase PhoE [Paenibacillus sp. PastH-2]MDH6510957.1 broad specificity phosphatase PhoE [Paenibacillus sp. PastM-3]
MRIGLVRHFKVEHPPLRGWVTGDQFNQWVAGYDEAGILLEAGADYGANWKYCICSDLSRAIHTARHIFAGEIKYSPELREIGVAAAGGRLSGFKLPSVCWMVLGRMLWLMGHSSQPESRRDITQRINNVLDHIEGRPEPTDVLLVTHGALMKLLERELRRRAYYGQRMNHPRNGQLYVYEK